HSEKEKDMWKNLVTRRPALQRRAQGNRGNGSSACRRSRFCSYRPLVEVLEDRTLLSFITAPTYAAGHYPDSVAVGDFNGDGHLDLAVANSGLNGTVSE